MEKFDYAADIGYTFRSLFGNYCELPAIPIQGQKITVFKFHTVDQINTRSLNINFIGYNDQGLNDSLKWWLIDRFPKKCKYEASLPSDKIIEIYSWMQKGKQYQQGVAIFSKYFKHQNLKMMFSERDTPGLREKLNYKLMQLTRQL
jgi:hypothetical protein